MAMTVSTKDTTALSDAELAEMADLCVDREPNFDIGFLSKQREDWVLVTQVREGNKLRGYSFCTSAEPVSSWRTVMRTPSRMSSGSKPVITIGT